MWRTCQLLFRKQWQWCSPAERPSHFRKDKQSPKLLKNVNRKEIRHRLCIPFCLNHPIGQCYWRLCHPPLQLLKLIWGMVATAFFCSITLGRTEEALTVLNMIRDTWKQYILKVHFYNMKQYEMVTKAHELMFNSPCCIWNGPLKGKGLPANFISLHFHFSD